MTYTINEELERQVKGTIEELNEAIEQETLYDYICESLDIKFISNPSHELLGGILAVALGGPNVYVDTYEKQIKGFWGNDNFYLPLDNDVVDELNFILEELFNI